MARIRTLPQTLLLDEQELTDLIASRPALTFEVVEPERPAAGGSLPPVVIVSGEETEVMLFLTDDCGIYDEDELWAEVEDQSDPPALPQS